MDVSEFEFWERPEKRKDGAAAPSLVFNAPPEATDKIKYIKKYLRYKFVSKY